MAYGYNYSRQPRIFLNNTAQLRAYLYAADGETLVPQSDISAVSFTILRPGDNPALPTVSGVSGSVVGDGEAMFVVPSSVNIFSGGYKGFARFIYSEDGSDHETSVPVNYDVVDVFETSGVALSDAAVDIAWTKLDDLFDSVDGGPWLRDVTKSHFDKDKMRSFTGEVIIDVNTAPPTPMHYTATSFPYGQNDGNTLIAQGLLVAAIRHLMRSYVEQPNAMNSQVAFYDRRDYQQRWYAIYQVEKQRWDEMLKNWKMNQYNAGGASILVSSKAGRQMPGYMRARSVGRGFY